MGSPAYQAVQPMLRSVTALPRTVSRGLSELDHSPYLEPLWQMLGIDPKPQPQSTAPMLGQPAQMPQKPMRMKR